MRTLLAAIAAVAIMGCASQTQQRRADPVVTATASPTPVARRTPARLSVATPSPSPSPVRPRSAPPLLTSRSMAVQTPSAAASSRSAKTPTSVPTAAPIQTASPTPVPSAPTPDAILELPPDAAPQILAMHIDHTTVHGGDTVSGSVVTSSNVASVEARIGFYSIPVPKISIGRFAVNYVVPYLPFFLHRRYTMQVIARNAAGVAVVRTIPIRVR
jgi:hypothetical protein